MCSSEFCWLDVLPSLCINRLCSYLSEKDVFHCCEVSKRFYALFIDNQPNVSITISISLLPAEEHVDRLFHLVYEHGHTRHKLYSHMRSCRKCRKEVESVFRLRRKSEIDSTQGEFLTGIKKKLEDVRNASKKMYVERQKVEVRKNLKSGEMLKGDVEQMICEKATELLRQKKEEKIEPVPPHNPNADKQKAILVRIGGQMRLLTEKDVEENKAFREQIDRGWGNAELDWMLGYEMKLEEESCKECSVYKANCIRINVHYESESKDAGRIERMQYDEEIVSRLSLFCRLYNPHKLIVKCFDFSQSYLLPPISYSFSQVIFEASPQDLASLQTLYTFSPNTTVSSVAIDSTIVLSMISMPNDDDTSFTDSSEEDD